MIKKIESAIIEAEDEERARVEEEIAMARQMCASMGNNDAEFNFLDDIWNRYIENRLTAKQAIKEARSIPENKIQR